MEPTEELNEELSKSQEDIIKENSNLEEKDAFLEVVESDSSEELIGDDNPNISDSSLKNVESSEGLMRDDNPNISDSSLKNVESSERLIRNDNPTISDSSLKNVESSKGLIRDGNPNISDSSEEKLNNNPNYSGDPSEKANDEVHKDTENELKSKDLFWNIIESASPVLQYSEERTSCFMCTGTALNNFIDSCTPHYKLAWRKFNLCRKCEIAIDFPLLPFEDGEEVGNAGDEINFITAEDILFLIRYFFQYGVRGYEITSFCESMTVKSFIEDLKKDFSLLKRQRGNPDTFSIAFFMNSAPFPPDRIDHYRSTLKHHLKLREECLKRHCYVELKAMIIK